MARAKKARLSISWDTRPGAVDVRSLLERLADSRGSPYFGRPLSEIGGMVLGKYLPQEVNSYKKQR